MTLLELAERCEKATGPDRELDRDIALRFGLYDQPEDLGCFHDHAEAVVGGGGQTWAPPSFTASLDAAMTLLPEGMLWLAGYAVDGRAIATVDFDHQRPAATPALALCAATLRARHAIAQPKGAA